MSPRLAVAVGIAVGLLATYSAYLLGVFAADLVGVGVAVEVAADVAAELTEGTTAGGFGFGPLARALEKEKQSSSARTLVI